MPFSKSASPICLSGINAALILYAQEILFKAKGNIYPFRYAKPQERLVALYHIIAIEHDLQSSGGNLLITLDDGSTIAIVYAERDQPQAQLLVKYLTARIHYIDTVAAVR